MMTLIWYPKCSTCQKAKKKLEELGASFETRDIVTQTPTAEELREWIRRGGLELRTPVQGAQHEGAPFADERG